MSREKLLEARPRRVESVEIDGIGPVYLRALSAREAMALIVALRDPDRTTPEGMAKLCVVQLAAFVSDADGQPLLSLEDAEAMLDQWRANDVRRLIRKGTEMNALDDDAVERAGKN